jgi:hypothetical protein
MPFQFILLSIPLFYVIISAQMVIRRIIPISLYDAHKFTVERIFILDEKGFDGESIRSSIVVANKDLKHVNKAIISSNIKKKALGNGDWPLNPIHRFQDRYGCLRNLN